MNPLSKKPIYSSVLDALYCEKWLLTVLHCRRNSIALPVAVKGGLHQKKPGIFLNTICSCHNFYFLSSVQIIIIPACCLLCVL